MKEKNIKIEGWIWAIKRKYHADHEFRYFEGSGESEYLVNEGYIKIAPYTIEIKLKDGLDLYAKTLEALQVKRKLVLANNEIALKKIDDEIKNFMAIENKE